MKITQEQYKKEEKKRPTASQPVVIDRTNETMVKSLDQLIKTLSEKEAPQGVDTKLLTSLVTELTEGNRRDYRAFIQYLGDKVEALTKTLKEKPSSFEFDVKRNHNGFINTVLVKSIK